MSDWKETTLAELCSAITQGYTRKVGRYSKWQIGLVSKKIIHPAHAVTPEILYFRRMISKNL